MQTPAKIILLAEDDASMRRFIEVTLTKAGYEVRSFEDGLTAFQSSLETVYDAVVTDAIMPNMTGYDLCRSIGRGKMPFIILSGLDNDVDDAEIADVFLTKDTNLKDNLLAAIVQLV